MTKGAKSAYTSTMETKKKKTSNPLAIPREALKPGWKACTFKLNPRELDTIDATCTRRRISKAQFMREAVQGMEVGK